MAGRIRPAVDHWPALASPDLATDNAADPQPVCPRTASLAQ